MRRRLFAYVVAAVVPLSAAAISSAAQASEGTMSISASNRSTGLFQPTLTAMSNVSSVSYGNQTVTFSGQLTAVPPGGGTAVPEPGFVVSYTPAKGAPVQVATTQSDGTYSGTISNLQPGTVVLTTQATTTVAAAQSNGVTITGIFQPLNLNNLTVRPAKLKYGQIATLTGTVDFGFGTTGVPGAVVRVADGTVNLPKATTGATGNFSMKFSTVNGQNLEITASDSNPLLTPGSVGISVQVPYPLRSKHFNAKLEGDGFVLSSICLLTSPTNFSQLQVNSVELQYAATPRGPWRKLGMIPGVESFSSSCDGQWSSFSDVEVPIPGRLIDAYYRVVLPASAVIEAFRSPVVHSFLLRSKVASFNVSPRTVFQGGHLNLTGHLQRKQGRKWRAYGHVRVVILARLKGRKDWSSVTSARTNASGHFSVRLTAGAGKGRLVFAALFPGNTKYLWSLSRQITVGFNESAAAEVSVSGGLRSLLVLLHGTGAVRSQQLPVPVR
jgi:hypothetical protein